MTLKGMTVQYLIHRTYAVKSGETILWHAAARRGLIAGQWLKALANAIGTVGSKRRPRLAKHLDARHQLQHGKLRREGEVAHRRQGCAGGLRLGGQDHLEGSLDCLRRAA